MLNRQVAEELGLSEKKIAGIKNIIFDLGGVIIDIHYNHTIEKFKKIGFTDFETIYTQIKQTPLFDLLETGKIHPQIFRSELQKYQPHLTNEQIDIAWNAMIGEMPSQNIDILKLLRKKYRTFLLSNTNEIHINYFYNYLKKTFDYNPMAEMFEHTYYSYEIGCRKPDFEAYEFVLKDAQIKPEETLFIDDLELNIAGAKQAGINTIHLVNQSVRNLFL